MYDDAGRQVQRLQYFSPGTVYQYVDQEATLMPVNVSGWLYAAELTSYDSDGRLLTQIQRTRSDNTIRRASYSGIEYEFPEWLAPRWDGDTDQREDVTVLTQVTTVSYQGAGKGYDAAGRVTGYSYTGQGYTHTYTYAYEGWDSYREKTVTGSSSNNNYKTTTSTMTFDAAGRQTEIREKTNGVTLDDRVRTFAFDGGGQLLSRRDGTVTSSNVFQQKDSNGQLATGAALGRMNLHNVYANGQQVAGLDEAGKLDVLSRLTAFSNTDAGKTQVVVQAGDSLRNIAQRVYGNANLWYVLAEANALDGDGNGSLVAGTTLTVPEVKTSANDANTFKPYNPGEITGPTSPGLPYIAPPPGGGGCGTLGMIIMVVVIVVVTIYTAGAASGAMGSAAAGTGTAGTTAGVTAGAATTTATAAGTSSFAATMSTGLSTLAGGYGTTAMVVGAGAGAFAGSVAGQAVGSTMGVASFSWRDAAQAGVSAALTAGMANTSMMRGINTALEGYRFAQAAVNAIAGQLTSYAASQVAGVDASFSWKRIAVSAVSAGVTAEAMPRFASQFDVPLGTEKGQFIMDWAGGTLGGAAAMHASRKLGLGGDVDYGRVMSDAFGNALANALSGNHARWAGEYRAAVGQVPEIDLSSEQRDIYDSWRQGGYSHQEAMSAVFPTYVGAAEFPFDMRFATASIGNGDIDLRNQINPNNLHVAGLEPAGRSVASTDEPAPVAAHVVTLETVRVDGSMLTKDSSIVMDRLSAAEQAWAKMSLMNRLFDHHRQGWSASKELDVARADVREFNRWPDEVSLKHVQTVLGNIALYDAGRLEAPTLDVIRARGYIKTVNRYYMGDAPFEVGAPSPAEVAFATKSAVDLQLAMWGVSSMIAGHTSRALGADEQRVLAAGQGAHMMAEIASAAYVQSNGRALPVATMASTSGRPRPAASDVGEAHNAASFARYKEILGISEQANPLVDSLRATGRLPNYFVTKQEAIAAGWRPGKALDNYIPGGQLGGDVFQNTTGVLPSAPGRVWYEADVGLNGIMSRANQPGTRLLYSNDGQMYITTDHYKTVHPFGGQ